MDDRATPQSCHVELRKARVRAGLSQREVQLRTGVRQAHIPRIENGQLDPRFSNVARMARAVGLEVPLGAASSDPRRCSAHWPTPASIPTRAARRPWDCLSARATEVTRTTTTRPVVSGNRPAMATEELAVRLHGEVGALARLRNGRTSFVFDPAYADRRTRPVLSLSFLGRSVEVREGRRAATGRGRSPPFFANLLPEGRLRAHLAAKAGVPGTLDFPLLRHLGRDLPGAAEFVGGRSRGGVGAARRRFRRRRRRPVRRAALLARRRAAQVPGRRGRVGRLCGARGRDRRRLDREAAVAALRGRSRERVLDYADGRDVRDRGTGRAPRAGRGGRRSAAGPVRRVDGRAPGAGRAPVRPRRRRRTGAH